MKRSGLILAACCLILGATACSSKQAEDKATDTAVVSEAETNGEDASKAEDDSREETKEEDGESTGETTKETEAEAENKMVTGRVTEMDETVITISGYDDLEYQIDTKDAETRSSLEIGVGDKIQVVFLDDGEDVKKAESYDILTSAAIEGDWDPVIEGAVKDAAMNSVVIETASGKTYTFSTVIAQQVTGDQGIVIGGNVEITYLGSADDGIALRVITEEGSGDADATYNVMLGTLVSCSDSAVTIEAADGRQFTFALDGSMDMEEFETGDELEITYEGSLTNQNAAATDVDYQ